MKRYLLLSLTLLAIGMWIVGDALARGGRGGGGGGGGGGGRGGGGGGGSAFRGGGGGGGGRTPSMSRPSGGMSRPSGGGGGMSRPGGGSASGARPGGGAVARPGGSRPSIGTLPTPGGRPVQVPVRGPAAEVWRAAVRDPVVPAGDPAVRLAAAAPGRAEVPPAAVVGHRSDNWTTSSACLAPAAAVAAASTARALGLAAA